MHSSESDVSDLKAEIERISNRIDAIVKKIETVAPDPKEEPTDPEHKTPQASETG